MRLPETVALACAVLVMVLSTTLFHPFHEESGNSRWPVQAYASLHRLREDLGGPPGLGRDLGRIGGAGWVLVVPAIGLLAAAGLRSARLAAHAGLLAVLMGAAAVAYATSTKAGALSAGQLTSLVLTPIRLSSLLGVAAFAVALLLSALARPRGRP